jgi:hypothetical protein
VEQVLKPTVNTREERIFEESFCVFWKELIILFIGEALAEKKLTSTASVADRQRVETG